MKVSLFQKNYLYEQILSKHSTYETSNVKRKDFYSTLKQLSPSVKETKEEKLP